MKLPSFTASLAVVAASLVGQTLADNKAFAGSNLFYAAGLSASEQTTLFEGLKSAGVKVLRVWLDGEPSNVKGTDITQFNSLEGKGGPGANSGWDDTVLNRLDDVMAAAHDYGIKLIISMHSFNTLQAEDDFYGSWYKGGSFYSDGNAKNYFKDRISHVMGHVNPHNGKTWAQSSEYIFAFEAQNEPDHDEQVTAARNQWVCEMAGHMKDIMSNSDAILTTTGGGSYLDVSLQDDYFNCAALDIVAAHAYGVGDFDTTKIKNYVQKAWDTGKKIMMQEWGACFTTASNENCNGGSALDAGTRGDNIRTWASQIAAAGVPWLYWQILPNEDPHQGWDYEVGINGVNWGDVQQAGTAASEPQGAWDWSKWLL